MITIPSVNKGVRELLSFIPTNGFHVSWAGAAQHLDHLCFGSEDGRMVYVDLDGKWLAPPQRVTPSGEAVNGVAFVGRWLSVSTRSEIMIFTPVGKTGEKSAAALVPFGAHDVIAGAGGYFFAPLGLTGLLSCQPKDGPEQSITVYKNSTEETYFYRVSSLRGPGSQTILASATRAGGVAAVEFYEGDEPEQMSTLSFNGLDVIDICPLNYGDTETTGAVALGRDGTLILFDDVMHQHNPKTTKYTTVKGIAYRVLSAGGYIFVLTSKGLYAIAGLIQRVSGGDTENPVTPILYLPLEASDASLVGSEWVLIMTPGGVLRLDVALLEKYTPVDLAHGERQEARPNWISPDWTSRHSKLHTSAGFQLTA